MWVCMCSGRQKTHIWSLATTDKSGSLIQSHFHKFLHLFILIINITTLQISQNPSTRANSTHFRLKSAVFFCNPETRGNMNEPASEGALCHTWPSLTSGPNRQSFSKGSDTLMLEAQMPSFFRNSSAIPSCHKKKMSSVRINLTSNRGVK